MLGADRTFYVGYGVALLAGIALTAFFWVTEGPASPRTLVLSGMSMLALGSLGVLAWSRLRGPASAERQEPLEENDRA